MANPDVFSAANTAFFAAKPPEKVLIVDIVNVASKCCIVYRLWPLWVAV
jgi:hypothetical protein